MKETTNLELLDYVVKELEILQKEMNQLETDFKSKEGSIDETFNAMGKIKYIDGRVESLVKLIADLKIKEQLNFRANFNLN